MMQAALDFTKPVVPMRSTLYACVNETGAPDDLVVLEGRA